MLQLETLQAAPPSNPTPRNLFSGERANRGGFELIFNEAREYVRTNDTPRTQNENRQSDNRQSDSRSRSQRRNDESHAPKETAPPRDEQPIFQIGEDEAVTPYGYVYVNPNEAAVLPYAQAAETTPTVNINYEVPPVVVLTQQSHVTYEVTEMQYAQPAEALTDAEIIELIAELLEITPEAVVELLEKLDIKPQELADPQVVAKLLQSFYEVATPMELLSEPAFPEMYKAINEAIAQKVPARATPTAPAAAPTVEIPVTESNTYAATNEAKPAAYTSTMQNAAETVTSTAAGRAAVPTIEGLVYAEENGQHVVTNAKPQDALPLPQATATQAAETNSASIESTLIPAEDAAVDPASVHANPLTNMMEARAQAVQTTQQTQQPQHVNPADVINQIMNQIRAHTGEQVTEMRLTLRPESLGDIVLRVLTQNGIVTAQFIAENQRVREALESGFNQLRDALEEQGIRFSELSVSVRDNTEEQMNQFERGRQRSRNRAESIEEIAVEELIPVQSLDFDNTINLTA